MINPIKNVYNKAMAGYNLWQAKRNSSRGRYQNAIKYLGNAAKYGMQTGQGAKFMNNLQSGVTKTLGNGRVGKFAKGFVKGFVNTAGNSIIDSATQKVQNVLHSELDNCTNFSVVKKVVKTGAKIATAPIKIAKTAYGAANHAIDTVNNAFEAPMRATEAANGTGYKLGKSSSYIGCSCIDLDTIKQLRDITFATLKYEGAPYWLVIINGNTAKLSGPYDRTKQLEKDLVAAKSLGYDVRIMDREDEAKELVKSFDVKSNNATLDHITESVTRGPGGEIINKGNSTDKCYSFSEMGPTVDAEGFPIPETMEDLTKVAPPADWYVVNLGKIQGPYTELAALEIYKKLENLPHKTPLRLLHGDIEVSQYQVDSLFE